MKYLPLFFLMLVASTPFAASASTPKPTCDITVTTPQGEVTISKSGKIFIRSGEKLTLAWESSNAKTAKDTNGDAIPLASTTVTFPTQDMSYTYTFSAGSKKATCTLFTVVASGNIDADSLTGASTKPTLTGTAEGTKSVYIEISDAHGSSVFKSKEIKTTGGKWSVKLTKSLAKGEYSVTVYGDKAYDLNELATGSLFVGMAGTASGSGSFSASAIPLLSGGTAAPGNLVPISYLKLVNTGKATTTLPGVWLKQSGSAPVSTVIGFSTVDDKAVLRTSVGGIEGVTPFKDGLVYVPLNATFAPGQFRIFTIKAQVSRNLVGSIGSTLMLDVASLDTTGTVAGTFPIRGTTWTLKAY